MFALAVNMTMKYAGPEFQEPQPPIRPFMDNLMVLTESVSGSRWILPIQGLGKLSKWADRLQLNINGINTNHL